jgi:prepilin-type N-terminal cleavage/methylation domain-containing protein
LGITLTKRNNGFTLIEISIVLAIIGLLTVSIIGGMSYVTSAKVTNAITLTQDISTAVNAFKQQFHMYPGDMLITNEVPGVRAECIKGGAKVGDSNGQIDNTSPTNSESTCVAEVLYKAGLAKVGQVNGVFTFTTYYGNAYVMATSSSTVVKNGGTFLPSIINIVELQNITCDVALTIDSKIDDGDLKNGKVQSDPNIKCDSGSNIVTTLDVAL